MGVGAERPRNWGGTTAFGADVGRIDLYPTVHCRLSLILFVCLHMFIFVHL